MKERVISKNRVVLVNTLAILTAAAIAIILHAIMPASVDLLEFDSVFVKLIGFPLVAVSYFVMLFLHCAIVMRYFGKHLSLPKLEMGFRFGLVFALIYLLGMQEVVVEASPFGEWGLAFVIYQLFMGLGDAVPVMLLCLTIAHFTLENTNTYKPNQFLGVTEKIKIVSLIAIIFLIQRAIGYETGFVISNTEVYPLPSYLWTALFGIVLGVSYVVLYPMYAKEHNKLLLSLKLVVLTIGVNWIIFNSFIGLIFSGAMPQMLLRSGIDTGMFFLSSIVISKYIIKPRIFSRYPRNRIFEVNFKR
ncbi:hypothetical protein [Desulfitibacter alkalitolerans]|uniref:hypothetical protein n=1 Tax=Desulfitibacter alkalitolerans TaxID=264641 RepID=UPI000480A387|nr:hypothetical protein [Desulfitibacter alkalitolerans]